MLLHGDCLERLRLLPDASIDAVVTDPPYELGFMRAWDSTGIANSVEVWREVLRVSKPGAHLLSFGGTRTYHRMACAVEDAGFEIRDQFQWLYGGTGMPKSKQQMKPAYEPIVLARKALIGTVAENVVTYGTGTLNIDGCRVEHANAEDLATSLAKNPGRAGEKVTSGVYGEDRPQQRVNNDGRWPANVLLDETTASELGESARYFYCAKASAEERVAGVEKNTHVAIKPLSLMRWLTKLICPPGGTILDPFAGSGTTGCAAALEGFQFIGIEKEAEYVEIARARIAYWSKK